MLQMYTTKTMFTIAMALVATIAVAGNTAASAYQVTPAPDDGVMIMIGENGTYSYLKPETVQYDFQVGPDHIPYTVTMVGIH